MNNYMKLFESKNDVICGVIYSDEVNTRLPRFVFKGMYVDNDHKRISITKRYFISEGFTYCRQKDDFTVYLGDEVVCSVPETYEKFHFSISDTNCLMLLFHRVFNFNSLL